MTPVPLPSHFDSKLDAKAELDRLEQIIETGLPKYNDVSLALLEIHDRKLFQIEYRSFGRYVAQRWNLSRSRAYQLLHFARLNKDVHHGGQASPINERQARQIGADGNLLPGAPTEYARLLVRVRKYLTANFIKVPTIQRPQFLLELQLLLDQLKQGLQPEQFCQSDQFLQNEAKLSSATTPADPARGWETPPKLKSSSESAKGYSIEEARKLGLV